METLSGANLTHTDLTVRFHLGSGINGNKRVKLRGYNYFYSPLSSRKWN